MKVPLVDLGRQHAIVRGDIDAGLSDLLENFDFIRGSSVEEFEHSYAHLAGVDHCVGVGSGTDALELALRAIGVGKGDEVIVPVNSFIATALAVLRAGADVVLVDSVPRTHLIDPEGVADSISTRTKAIIPVHLFGQIAPMKQIAAAAGEVPIIEDAAQSHGAEHIGQQAGSFGVAAGTSFYPGKNLGAYGDAGAVLTNDRALAQRARALGNWGSQTKYHHPIQGFNSRLDTIQAVVLNAKLRHLADWNRQRSAAASIYDSYLASTGNIERPEIYAGNLHVWHLYVVEIPNRDTVARRMREKGIGVGVHYPVPMHLQGALAHLGHSEGDFPVAEAAASRILSLPIFPGIEESEVAFVAQTLIEAVKEEA